MRAPWWVAAANNRLSFLALFTAVCHRLVTHHAVDGIEQGKEHLHTHAIRPAKLDLKHPMKTSNVSPRGQDLKSLRHMRSAVLT
eukprot:scaffold120686_cov18-Prasinocladus_malaysianus.AAC.1